MIKESLHLYRLSFLRLLITQTASLSDYKREEPAFPQTLFRLKCLPFHDRPYDLCAGIYQSGSRLITERFMTVNVYRMLQAFVAGRISFGVLLMPTGRAVLVKLDEQIVIFHVYSPWFGINLFFF